jgi:hypothetical protein
VQHHVFHRGRISWRNPAYFPRAVGPRLAPISPAATVDLRHSTPVAQLVKTLGIVVPSWVLYSCRLHASRRFAARQPRVRSAAALALVVPQWLPAGSPQPSRPDGSSSPRVRVVRNGSRQSRRPSSAPGGVYGPGRPHTLGDGAAVLVLEGHRRSRVPHRL